MSVIINYNQILTFTASTNKKINNKHVQLIKGPNVLNHLKCKYAELFINQITQSLAS
jgi:hypothetical protein